MKKTVFILLITVLLPITAAAQEAYTVLFNGTLTFFYDNYRDARTGDKFDLNYSSGAAPSWIGYANDITTVVFDPSFAQARPETTESWFHGCESLTQIVGIQFLNTSEVKSMSSMFSRCIQLPALDVSGFDTRNVTDMSSMFFHCEALTALDVSSFNTDKVTTMGSMFYFCENLKSLDVSGFNTSNVNNLGYMFGYCNKLEILDVTHFDTQNVITMKNMFQLCEALPALDLSGFNTSNVKNMSYMFDSCSNLESLDLSGFDMGKVETIYGMFWDCDALTTIDGINSWDTSNITDMSMAFCGCDALTTLDLSNWNTGNVTNMGRMFDNCSKLKALDLSGWDTSNVENMYWLFNFCPNLTAICVGDGWKMDKVSNTENMFFYCLKLVGGQGTTYDEGHTDGVYAHVDGGPSTPGYFTMSDKEPYAVYYVGTLTFYYDRFKSQRGSLCHGIDEVNENEHPLWQVEFGENVTEAKFDPSFAEARPTSTRYWFYSMSHLKKIDGIKYLNTSEVRDMSFMFSSCSSLDELDVSGFNMERVSNMSYMFLGCLSLVELDVSGWNTWNVMLMPGVFWGCVGLHNIDVSNWRVYSAIDMYALFYGCTNLTTLDLSGWNTRSLRNTQYMFIDCSNLTTIYVGKFWNMKSVTNSINMFGGCTSLVGGKGTTFDPKHADVAYAHLDGGPSNPGYLSEKRLLGDVNDDGKVNSADVQKIYFLMAQNADGSTNPEADVNNDGYVNSADIQKIYAIMATK